MKYTIDFTTTFKKQYKKLKKQNKDLNKLHQAIEKLASGEELEPHYQNHNLTNDKKYKNCKECHIEPNWLLIYKINKKELILILFSTGSHNELFNKY